MAMLRIINRHNADHMQFALEGGFEIISVTRPTPLGNPYPVTRESEREEAIRLYERWLWKQMHSDPPQSAEIKRIIKALRDGGKVAARSAQAPWLCTVEFSCR